MAVYTYAGRYGPENVIDQSTGRPIPGAAVEVFLRGTSNRASLYLDRTKALSQVNPTATDARGNLTFFADPGEYDILVNGATLPVTVPIDPAEAAQDVNTGTSAADVLLGMKVQGDSFNRFEATAAGVLQWGSGAAAPDVKFERHIEGSVRLVLPFTSTFAFTQGAGLKIVNTNNTGDHMLWLSCLGGTLKYQELGGLEVTGGSGFGLPESGAVGLFQAGTPPTKGLIIRGAAAQTANLQQWQNSAGSLLAALLAGGSLRVRGNDDVTGPPGLDVEGAWIRIGDGVSGSGIFPNGLGIKFHDAGISHASIKFQNQGGGTARGFEFGPSLNTSDLTLDSIALAIRTEDVGIADTQTALLVRRNVGGAFSLQRVSMGAVDSGGVGFKLLRVAN